MQTETGVKDQLAEYWIQQLIVKAREEQQRRIRNPATRDPRLQPRQVPHRARVVAQIELDIQRELIQWLVTQPEAEYSKLPQDSRMRSIFILAHIPVADMYSPLALRTELRAGTHFNALLTVEGLGSFRSLGVPSY